MWGCAEDDVTRSDITLVSINGNNALQSDVVDNGQDGIPSSGDEFVADDAIRLVFRNDPSDAQVTGGPTGAFSAVTFDRYRVSFAATDPIGAVSGGMHSVVEATGDTTSVIIVAVPALLKLQSPLFDLRSGGEIVATAHLELWGEEKTSGDNVYVDGYLGVTFADHSDE
jgi:hypothetical protein